MTTRFKPDVLDKLDSDQWADKYSDALGDKVAIIRKRRAQQQAAQAQLAAAEQVANTAKSASQVDTTVQNGLTDVMAALTGYSTPGLRG